MSDSELLHKIQEKMAKERRVMQGAQAMRQSSNPQVQALMPRSTRLELTCDTWKNNWENYR
jgi:hypothetical protein